MDGKWLLCRWRRRAGASRSGGLVGQAQAVGVDGAHRAALRIEGLAGDHRIAERADRTFPGLQFDAGCPRHESAVGEQGVSLIDVEPLDRSGLVKRLGEIQVGVERGEQPPAALYRRGGYLPHPLVTGEKNRAL